MCNNPLCDIDHDGEACAAREDDVPDSRDPAPARLRRLVQEIAAGFGAVLAFTAIMAGMTTLRLWHALPPLRLPG
jgi:hypothetical protein